MKQPVKEIRLRYPSLMCESAAADIKALVEEIDALHEEKHDLFTKEHELDTLIAEKKKYLDGLKGMYEVIYEEETPKEKPAFEGEAISAPTIVESNGTIHI